jgi:hypothetical protein
VTCVEVVRSARLFHVEIIGKRTTGMKLEILGGVCFLDSKIIPWNIIPRKIIMRILFLGICRKSV